MNVETADLELLTAEKIPDDCNILMINGPTSDLADNEKKIVLDYLKAGGNAIINLSYTTEKMTNLEEVLELRDLRQVLLLSKLYCTGTGNRCFRDAG